MIKRISYYFKKASSGFKQRGVVTLFKETFQFLVRRKFFLQFFLESMDYHFLSHFRDCSHSVIRVLKDQKIESKRVMLYANYDMNSFVHPHVVQQLSAFHDQGYEIIFVSTSEKIPPSEFDKIRNFISVCVHRRNEGYDFVSWKIGQKFIVSQMKSIDSLVIMNDSCLGPAYDLTETLVKMRASPNTVYGISKSEEISEHIQSYFYHFSKDLLRKEISQKFFDRIRILSTKWGIVRYFEFGGSNFLKQEKVVLKALIELIEKAVSEQMK